MEKDGEVVADVFHILAFLAIPIFHVTDITVVTLLGVGLLDDGETVGVVKAGVIDGMPQEV